MRHEYNSDNFVKRRMLYGVKNENSITEHLLWTYVTCALLEKLSMSDFKLLPLWKSGLLSFRMLDGADW